MPTRTDDLLERIANSMIVPIVLLDVWITGARFGMRNAFARLIRITAISSTIVTQKAIGDG